MAAKPVGIRCQEKHHDRFSIWEKGETGLVQVHWHCGAIVRSPNQSAAFQTLAPIGEEHGPIFAHHKVGAERGSLQHCLHHEGTVQPVLRHEPEVVGLWSVASLRLHWFGHEGQRQRGS
jgi:hypothetical protein